MGTAPVRAVEKSSLSALERIASISSKIKALATPQNIATIAASTIAVAAAGYVAGRWMGEPLDFISSNPYIREHTHGLSIYGANLGGALGFTMSTLYTGIRHYKK
jgi:hypothetical protein